MAIKTRVAAIVVAALILLSAIPTFSLISSANDDKSNLVEYIDFGEDYAKGHRDASGYPRWEYYSEAKVGADARTTFLADKNAMEFLGITNSGNSYGNRAVVLANKFNDPSKIVAGNKYMVVFDLLLKGEELSTRTVDIRFGNDVWSPDSSYNNPVSAADLKLSDEKPDEEFTAYTLSTVVTAPVSKNMMISVYGTGNNVVARIKNIYIYKTSSYTVVDQNGKKVCEIGAFAGENVEEIIPNSTADKPGFFETPISKTVPEDLSEPIKVKYEEDPSFVSFVDFSDSYASNGSRSYYISNGTSSNPNIFSWSNGCINIATNSKTEKDGFVYRSCLLSNDYKSKGLVAGTRYMVTFNLSVASSVDISKFNVEFRSGRYAGSGLGSSGANSNPLIYTGDDLSKYIVSTLKTASEKIYTISLPYTLAEESAWGSYTERNILMSVFGGNVAAKLDNIEIGNTSVLKFGDKDYDDIVGRIGHPIAMPENPAKKGKAFSGWFLNAEKTEPFTAKVFGEKDITVYSKFEDVSTETEMNFTSAPPASASMTNFSYNADGNISAKTDKAGKAYIKMYSDGKPIRISPANFYPVSFDYKVSGISAKITIGIATASKDDFNKANSVLASKTLNASSSWAKADFCGIPNLAYDNGTAGDYLYFFVEYEENANGKIFIDNIVLKQETAISFETNGATAIDTIKGEPNSEITLPIPVKSGSTFSGWYYDKDLKSKVSGTKIRLPISGCNMKLYAAWNKPDAPITTDDFETYKPTDITNSGNEYEQRVFTVSNSEAYSGNTSMHYRFDPSTTKSITEQQSTFKLMGDSGSSHSGITVEKGKTYVLSFYVLAKSLPVTTDFNVFTAQGTSGLNKGTKQSGVASGDAARIAPKFFPKDEWKKVEYVFPANFSTAGADEIFLSVHANSAKELTDLYIDYVTLEELPSDMSAVAFATSVYSYTLVEMEYNYVIGKIGSSIPFPKVARENYVLEGWYTGYTYAKPFPTEFDETSKMAYPQWDIDGEVKVSLENVADYQRDGTGTGINHYTNHGGGEVVVGEKASDGKAAYKVEGTKSVNWQKVLALKESDGSPFRIVDGRSYVILVDVYLEKYGSDFGFNFSTGSQDNYYAWQGSTTGSITVNGDTPTGKWITTALTITGSFSYKGGFNLFMCNTVSGNSDTVVYFDNFRIRSLDPVNPTIIINKGLIAGDVDMISGKPGTPYKLPDNVDVPGYDFAGWFSSPAMTKTVDAEGEFLETKTVYAKMIPKKYVNDFEKTTYDFSKNNGGDMDYEIYDKNEQGHSASNVHDGDKSLHRIGNDYQHKNAVIVTKNATLATGEPYELSMWVKMDKYDHTNGAIKVASCSSKSFAWDLMGDMRAVIPIKDLTDGKWHHVTYKFMASAYYLAIQTPGYCSIYFDDIEVTHLKTSGMSSEPSYTEYVPIEKDANGNIPKIVSETDEKIVDTRLDVYEDYQKKLDKLNDMEDDDEYDDDEYDENSSVNRVKKKSTTVTRKRNPLTFKDILICNSYVWYTVVFYVGVGVLLAGIGLVIFLILWKKRKKGGK